GRPAPPDVREAQRPGAVEVDDRRVLRLVGEEQVAEAVAVGDVLDTLGQRPGVVGRPLGRHAHGPDPRLGVLTLDARELLGVAGQLRAGAELADRQPGVAERAVCPPAPNDRWFGSPRFTSTRSRGSVRSPLPLRST